MQTARAVVILIAAAFAVACARPPAPKIYEPAERPDHTFAYEDGATTRTVTLSAPVPLPLDELLETVALQTGLQIISVADVAEGLEAVVEAADAPPAQVLDALTLPLGLLWHVAESGVVEIHDPASWERRLLLRRPIRLPERGELREATEGWLYLHPVLPRGEFVFMLPEAEMRTLRSDRVNLVAFEDVAFPVHVRREGRWGAVLVSGDQVRSFRLVK